MLFSSITFLFYFLPVTLLLYYLLPSKCRNILLLVASLIFYAWGEPVYIILMLLSIAFNYVGGLDIAQKSGDRRLARRSLALSLAVNLALLGVFKYFTFFTDTLSRVLPFDLPSVELPLPIGISFYTFQAISYLIDVYRGNAEVQKNPIHFALYISMFPQLIAGPIVRYSEIENQLQRRKLSLEQFGYGARLFIIGLAKKVILANGIGALFSEFSAEVTAGQAAVGTAWLGAAAYMLQIYFDFSGYSDMAIGLGHMFGFQFRKNFNHPYIARSITDFWRRWHISLSSWFREYLYIPLGGNRVSVPRHIFNLLVVWFLTGFWHGAAWNFIFWGLYYGILLILEKYVWGRWLEKLPVLLQHLYSLLIILIGWVFFFSDTMAGAWQYLDVMFGAGAASGTWAALLYDLKSNWLLLLAGVICASDIPVRLRNIHGHSAGRIPLTVVLEMALFLLTISCLVTETYNPFLYFRF
ncbi:MAG: MBOAT family protein [Clostridiales bacterium]|nr:MBOAT family protein [Clostridiales bacterium]